MDRCGSARRWLQRAPALGIAGLLGTALLFAALRAGHPGIPRAAGPVPLRRVLIVRPGSPPDLPVVQARRCGPSPACPNGARGLVVVQLLAGRPPARPTAATVRTDEDCAPDGYGISHCRNVLRLADGTEIAVRDEHNMARYPCLAPGERVEVSVV